MYIYILGLLITLFLAFFSSKIKQKVLRHFFQFLSFFPLFIISAIRYDVGTDYIARYSVAYRIIASGGDVSSIEIGFKLLIKLCTIFTSDSVLLFIITSLLIIFPIFILIYKESVKPIFSIFIFFTLGFYFQSMNILREYVAISILILGFYLFVNNRKKLGLFLSISSYFIHNLSILGIFYYLILFLSKKKLKINLPLLFTTIISIFLFRGIITEIFVKLVSYTRFTGYIGSVFDTSQFNKATFIINLLELIIMLIIQKREKLYDQKSIFYVNMQMLAMICLSLSSVFSLFNRIVCYFTIFLIVSLPYFLMKYKNIKKRMVCYLVIICLFSFNIYYSNVMNDYGGVIPYKTIYDRG